MFVWWSSVSLALGTSDDAVFGAQHEDDNSNGSETRVALLLSSNPRQYERGATSTQVPAKA